MRPVASAPCWPCIALLGRLGRELALDEDLGFTLGQGIAQRPRLHSCNTPPVTGTSRYVRRTHIIWWNPRLTHRPDGWTNGRTGRVWTARTGPDGSGRVRTGGRVDGRVRTDGRVDGRTDGWTGGRLHRPVRTDGRTTQSPGRSRFLSVTILCCSIT